ncbi:hypothetical protein M3Y97_00891500 [Aphelenchoides bicaudatus]|nr:hypothetical protein M3Y97_00891500 [Aphelenchoides bicaudatus]
MTEFLRVERTAPLFYYLQFIFEKLTVLNFNVNGRVRKITISANTSDCVICSDQSLLNVQDWDEKSKNFYIGKHLVIDAKTNTLEVTAETTNEGLLKGQMLLEDVGNGKPTRCVVQLLNRANLPALELQCIIFKRPLHYQLNTEKRITSQSISVAQTIESTKVSVGTQTGKSSQHPTQTEVYATSAHQKQVLIRMVVMLINRVHTRLLEYQLDQKAGKVVSKQVNTDFTLPVNLTQQELNNSITTEHLQSIKKRLNELSKQHRECSTNEQKSKLNRVQRICPAIEQNRTKMPIPLARKPLFKKSPPREVVLTKKEAQVIKEVAVKKTEETPKQNEKLSSRGSVKSWISSLHSNGPKVESSSKLTSVSQKAASSKRSTKTSITSEDVSSKTLSDVSDEETSSETTATSETDSSDTTESESAEDETESNSSSVEEMNKSSGSSIPTEINSKAAASERSYLESVASSSDSAQKKKPLASDLSPTSAYLQKLQTDVESLDTFLQNFVSEEIEYLPTIEFKASGSSFPRCSLTKSSRSSCISLSAKSCDRFDERCPYFWFKKAGSRSVKCFDLTSKQINCNINGYAVQSIHHNSTQLNIFMSAISTQQSLQQIKVEEIQDCQNYFAKQDQSLFEVSIPESTNKLPTKKIPLHQNTQTVIFYPTNQQQDLASLTGNILNTTKLCNCKSCYAINKQDQPGIELNKTIAGFTAQLLAETNETYVNLTATLQDENENVGQIDFKMKREVVDRTTPMFWRRPGRFECPSEITCPLELLYIFKIQADLAAFDYILEFCFLIAIICYLKKRDREYLKIF